MEGSGAGSGQIIMNPDLDPGGPKYPDPEHCCCREHRFLVWYGSEDLDPDPYQNVTDPEHCFRDFCSFSQLADSSCRRCWLLPGSPVSSSSSAAIHWAAPLPPSSPLSSYWSAISKASGQDFFQAEFRKIYLFCFTNLGFI